jgi:hypothetical protein
MLITTERICFILFHHEITTESWKLKICILVINHEKDLVKENKKIKKRNDQSVVIEEL